MKSIRQKHSVAFKAKVVIEALQQKRKSHSEISKKFSNYQLKPFLSTFYLFCIILISPPAVCQILLVRALNDSAFYYEKIYYYE